MNFYKKIKLYMTDVILVLFSIIVICVICLYLFSDNTSLDFSPTKNIIISAKISKLPQYDEQITVGNKVFDTETGQEIGTVAKAVYTPSFESVIDAETGSVKNIYHPEFSDVDIEIHCQISSNKAQKYKVGQNISINVPQLAFTAEIYEINETLSLNTANDNTNSYNTDYDSESLIKSNENNQQKEAV